MKRRVVELAVLVWLPVALVPRSTATTGDAVTVRVSVASDGAEGNGEGFFGPPGPSMSSDGRFVAFDSAASNLVTADTNGRADVFVHDVLSGETTRVSVASDGTQADHLSAGPRISADGRIVAFESFADNLVPGDTNGSPDVFVHNRVTGRTTPCKRRVRRDPSERGGAGWHLYQRNRTVRGVRVRVLDPRSG
jgi:hypothetical protein